MKVRLIPIAMLAAMFAASCSNEEVVDVNPDVKGDAIKFSPTVGHATRATETNIGNLGDFAVFAKAVHPNTGNIYPDFIIGKDDGTPDIAKYDEKGITDNAGTWELTNHTVSWPNGVNQVIFWAYTALKREQKYEGTDVLGGSGTVKISSGIPGIENFSPAKATVGKDAPRRDGSVQQDLLTAFKAQKHTEGTTISLGFKHVLSQIAIEAYQNNKISDTQTAVNHRVVKIKGAWIVNPCGVGSLSAGFNHTTNRDVHEYTDEVSWNDLKSLTSYGSLFENPITLTNTPKNILSNNTDENGNLMIIPQTLEPWSGKEDETSNSYILLLCRIELEHDELSHTTTKAEGENDETIKVDTENKKHYHQQFPVSAKYNSEEYGYACVPIGITLEKGKKYKILLDICGKNTGAGVYPPTNIPSDIPDGVEKPDDKNPGDQILDEPIKFSVKVSDWVDDTNWKPGNVTM